jgi:hypothetical protein
MWRESSARVPGAYPGRRRHSLESSPEPALPAPPLVFLNGVFSPFVQPRGKPFLAESVATRKESPMNRLELLVRPFQFSGQIWSTQRSTITAE